MEAFNGTNFNFTQTIDFNVIRHHINKNIIEKYGEKAAEETATPIFYSDTIKLMPIEVDMCMKILNIWELDRYDIDIEELVNSKLLIPTDKFIQRTLTGKILRLIPGGVTILSIGINSSVARRFTLALGHAMSELSCLYIQSVRENNGENVDVLTVFTKEAMEDFMDDYLVNYNKRVMN